MKKYGTWAAMATKLQAGEFILCDSWRMAQGIYRVLKRRNHSTFTKVQHVNGRRMWRVYKSESSKE